MFVYGCGFFFFLFAGLVWGFFDFKPEDDLGVVLGLCYLCKYQQCFDLKSQTLMFI